MLSSWLDWIKGWLYDWGLLYKDAKFVILGLDDSGKTTLLNLLKTGRIGVFKPTQKPKVEELVMGSLKIRAWDLGGHEVAREAWEKHYTDADAIVYLVDAANRKRLKESRDELARLMTNHCLRHTPICILANKIDIKGVVDESKFRKKMGLIHTTGKFGVQKRNYADETEGISQQPLRPIEVFMCSILKKQGIHEAFKWLSQLL